MQVPTDPERPMPRRFTAFLCLILMACTSGRPARATRDRTVLTAEEIAATQLVDAYEVVQALRPEFLRTRGPASIRQPEAEKPVVYIDGVKTGDPTTLRRVTREVVKEIRYLDSREATTRFGTGHGAGAILVTTK
jgi:hypothetical protein